jgi:WD40 repeat protein
VTRSPSFSPSQDARQAPVVQVLGARPFHTDGEVLALAFAADGSLWSVEDPGILRHWEAGSGKQADWHALTQPAMLWQFSGGARLAASAGNHLTIWDVVSGRPLAVLPQSSWITTLAFSPDALLLATGHDDGMVRIWDIVAGRLADEWLAHPSPLSALAFNREGTELATAGEERTICLWRADTAELQIALAGHTDRVPALAWHPGGNRLYSAGWDTTVRVWDTTSGEPVILLNSHAAQVTALAVNAAGSLLASADSAEALHLW